MGLPNQHGQRVPLGDNAATIPDPGNGGLVSAEDGGVLNIGAAGPGETRNIAPPTYVGQLLTVVSDPDESVALLGDFLVSNGFEATQQGAFPDDIQYLIGIKNAAGTLVWFSTFNLNRNIRSSTTDGEELDTCFGGTFILASAGAETRDLPDPTFIGQTLTLLCLIYGGDIDVTTASDVNAAGNDTLTFTAVNQSITLQGVSFASASVLRWRVLATDGVGIS